MIENTFSDLERSWNELRQGEEQGLFNLYKELYNPLFNYGFSLYGARENVEDAISQVFLELWENRLMLKHVSNVKSYLFTYLRRKISRQQNVEARKLIPDVEEYDQSIMEYIVELQVEEERKQHILSAINKLTARQKQLIMYKFYENLEYHEISAITGLATQTIYNNIHQSLTFLRDEVKLPLGVLLILLRS